MNAEQQAINEWFDSPEGRSCSSPEGLALPADTYLRNRLWKAFTAGFAAGRLVARDEAVAAFRRMLES